VGEPGVDAGVGGLDPAGGELGERLLGSVGGELGDRRVGGGVDHPCPTGGGAQRVA
jgi:hypothetical protein